MITKKFIGIFTSHDDDYKLQKFITKVNESDERKTEQYKNRSTYVNPHTLRLGYYNDKGKAFYRPQHKDYCPV
ncbi:MAG: hypothetical protein US70_C0020G0017 [Parcubacteria group bacterium GW2011_GWD2_38_11]|nr:MAG: hypothetical protein US70_C0020G0017 [Parcubacteria group bacterium GW2011_GWD2_38_11]